MTFFQFFCKELVPRFPLTWAASAAVWLFVAIAEAFAQHWDALPSFVCFFLSMLIGTHCAKSQGLADTIREFLKSDSLTDEQKFRLMHKAADALGDEE